MKNLSLVDNQWIQRINPNITVQERSILEDTSEANIDIRNTLRDSVRSRSIKNATDSDATLAQNIYNQYKISDSDLISVDIFLPGGHGIINCRVNNEHKQIRF